MAAALPGSGAPPVILCADSCPGMEETLSSLRKTEGQQDGTAGAENEGHATGGGRQKAGQVCATGEG